MYAEVALSKSSRFLDKFFTYLIPAKLTDKVQVGSCVLIPFGRRQEIGYVVGLLETSEVEGIKEIIEISREEPFFDEKGVALARWIADYYMAFFPQVQKLLLPPGKFKAFKENDKGKQISTCSIDLTPEQAKAADAIKNAITADRSQTFLLYGPNGSGKTEAYLQSFSHLLKSGKSAIVLVPEIGLISQLSKRIEERFPGQCAVLHSELTDKQRANEWERIARGEARIILGTRNALFAPAQNLGLIIMVNEQETSYKSDRNPRFHAREVALELAKLKNLCVVISSATPSLETFYKVETGEYKMFSFSGKSDNRPSLRVEVVDMRNEAYGALSNKLKKELKEVLERGEQAILLVNHRGFFTYVLCKDCGQALECPNCSASLNYFSSDTKLHCNLCGFISQTRLACSRCHSSNFKYSGAGTQRVEDEVAKLYPAVRIMRIDRDTVTKKGKHAEIFQAFSEHKADVMIGTQMVIKGLALENVTLVGVVSADGGLNFPDFRSGEKTFQLLTQAASRAGRGSLQGKVILQTYNPEHYVIQAAVRQDYEMFYRQEIEHRKELGYPPFSKLINLFFAGPDQNKTLKAAENFAQLLREKLAEGVLGPAQTVIPKVRGAWRYQILLKGKELQSMRDAVREGTKKAAIPSEIKFSIDIEPMGIS